MVLDYYNYNKKRKEDVKVYSSSGTILIKNIIKRGMDSSKFINMIVCYPEPDKYQMNNCPVPPNIFFIHDITFSEALGVLINEFKIEENEAKRKIKNWIEKYQIKRIKMDEVPAEYEKIAGEANRKVIQQFGDIYKIGEKDIKIIAGFLKESINIAHVRDKGFEKTCQMLGINIIPTVKRDIEKEKRLKERLRK